MTKNLIARASVVVDADRADVWHALTDADAIAVYMFGAEVSSDWREGSPIVWKGEWKGKAYEDKGEVQRVERHELLEYTHFSPMSGLPDEPENYHTVTIELDDDGERGTRVVLTQDGNDSEEAREHSARNWQTMLDGLKKLVEAE